VAAPIEMPGNCFSKKHKKVLHSRNGFLHSQAKVDSFLENSQNGIFLELFYIKKQQKINPLTSARICRKCYIFLKLFFGT